MASHLHTVVLRIALIAVLVPEPGTAVITAEFKDNVCPKQQFSECTRRMYSKTQYAFVKSRMFGANFLCDTETDQGKFQKVIIKKLYLFGLRPPQQAALSTESTNTLTDQHTNIPTYQQTNRPTDQQTNRPTD
ncbi:hypothetical protein Btru_002574 [Bulinus truncatus]|nr:hypothetical protein Btru_002574 [Bulinus truncatus]